MSPREPREALVLMRATQVALLVVTSVLAVASAFFTLLAPNQWLMAFVAGAAIWPVFQLTKLALSLKQQSPKVQTG